MRSIRHKRGGKNYCTESDVLILYIEQSLDVYELQLCTGQRKYTLTYLKIL